MKAIITAAIVAALVGGGAATAASRISGRMIRPHSLPLNRLVSLPPRGPLVLHRVEGQEFVVQPGETGFAHATCPRGTLAVSGGFAVVAQLNPAQVVGLVSEPMVDLSGWVSGYQDTGTTPATVDSYAICTPGAVQK